MNDYTTPQDIMTPEATPCQKIEVRRKKLDFHKASSKKKKESKKKKKEKMTPKKRKKKKE